MIEAAVLVLAIAALLAAAAVAAPRLMDLWLRYRLIDRPGAVGVRGWDGVYRTPREHSAHEKEFWCRHAKPETVGMALTPPLPIRTRRKAS